LEVLTQVHFPDHRVIGEFFRRASPEEFPSTIKIGTVGDGQGLVYVVVGNQDAGVDPIAVEEIQSIVGRLKKKNIGILITDHNVDETLTITDRAYLMVEGNSSGLALRKNSPMTLWSGKCTWVKTSNCGNRG